MGVEEHRREAETASGARCAVLTVSDSRTVETDESGRVALEILAKYGHEAVEHRIVSNDASEIRGAMKEALRRADLVAALGGTGPGPRDVTVEAARSLVEKELPGFGEMFRARSEQEIGTAVILTRAVLGVTPEGKIVVCTPGSPSAVRLALEGILMEELKHLLREVRRSR